MAIESCSCPICRDDASRQDDIVETVRKHGWTPLWIVGGIDFAYTVGLWHTMRQPELVMFGLQGSGMQEWLNTCVELCRDQGWPGDGEEFVGVIEEFPTQLRAVHSSWHGALFGSMLRFYGGEPVPVRQLVWPDRNGRWPWHEDATVSSRNRQAWAWLPVAKHPSGGWRLVGEMSAGFPFPTSPDAWTLAPRALLDVAATPVRVVRDQGSYDVLDARGYAADDLCLVFLGELVRRHPSIAAAADLVDGQVAQLEPDGSWTRSYLSIADRRVGRRCWTLAEPLA